MVPNYSIHCNAKQLIMSSSELCLEAPPILPTLKAMAFYFVCICNRVRCSFRIYPILRFWIICTELPLLQCYMHGLKYLVTSLFLDQHGQRQLRFPSPSFAASGPVVYTTHQTKCALCSNEFSLRRLVLRYCYLPCQKGDKPNYSTKIKTMNGSKEKSGTNQAPK